MPERILYAPTILSKLQFSPLPPSSETLDRRVPDKCLRSFCSRVFVVGAPTTSLAAPGPGQLPPAKGRRPCQWHRETGALTLRPAPFRSSYAAMYAFRGRSACCLAEGDGAAAAESRRSRTSSSHAGTSRCITVTPRWPVVPVVVVAVDEVRRWIKGLVL